MKQSGRRLLFARPTFVVESDRRSSALRAPLRRPAPREALADPRLLGINVCVGWRRAKRRSGEQADALSRRDRLDPRVRVLLPEHASQVVANRLGGERELPRNFGRGQAGGDQADYLALARGQSRLPPEADGLYRRLAHVESDNESAHDRIAVSERELLDAHATEVPALSTKTVSKSVGAPSSTARRNCAWTFPRASRGSSSVNGCPSSWAFDLPEARSAAAFMCTNRPSTSWRVAGTTRLSTSHRSTPCIWWGIAITCWTDHSPGVNLQALRDGAASHSPGSLLDVGRLCPRCERVAHRHVDDASA
jgi:hypothetical protein